MFDMGKLLKELRIQRNMTQERVANALEVTATTVGRWERNYKIPSTEHLARLAVLFNVSVNFILGIQKESVIVIDQLTTSQQQLVIDITSQFTSEEKHKRLSRKQKEIICGLLDEFLKGE